MAVPSFVDLSVCDKPNVVNSGVIRQTPDMKWPGHVGELGEKKVYTLCLADKLLRNIKHKKTTTIPLKVVFVVQML